MLQSLSNKLNRLNDVRVIGETITAELRSLSTTTAAAGDIGRSPIPVAFRTA
jgi:hypothetical protein